MEKRNIGMYVTITLIVLFVLFNAYKLLPDNPEIKIAPETESLENAISPEEIVKMIRSSDEYKKFDRFKIITSISVSAIPLDSDTYQSRLDSLQERSGVEFENDLYKVFVRSTSTCFSTTSIEYYIDSTTGEILHTMKWKEC